MESSRTRRRSTARAPRCDELFGAATEDEKAFLAGVTGEVRRARWRG